MSRPIASVHIQILKLAKHVYRLQAKGPDALADWLVALTDCLVNGDPILSEFGAELLADPKARCVAISRLRGDEWDRVRNAVFLRDRFICQYCWKRVDKPHCDHVIPKSRGGKDEIENLKTACPECNLRKGARTPAEWMAA